jgi:hypothetical protein
MQAPAPTNAASTAAANTSFKRIRQRPLIWFWANFRSLGWWEKNAAKNTTRQDQTRRYLNS